MERKEIVFKRLNMTLKLISISLVVLIVSLFRIQIIDHEKLSAQTDRQSKMSIGANIVRGDILDRNGIALTRADEVIYLAIYPKLLEGREGIIDIIKTLTSIKDTELKEKMGSKPHSFELEIKNPDTYLMNQIVNNIYPGLFTYAVDKRYDEKSIARHIVGYIQEDGYPMMGIEKNFNQFLDGADTDNISIFKDANNNPIFGAGYIYDKSSNIYHDVQLTLDYRIQEIVEKELDSYGGRAGAIVIDIESGDILAAASRPNYKQYDISGSMEPDCLWAVPFKAFPPGSVFKIIVAAAALEEGGYVGDDIFYCPGGVNIHGVFYPCHQSIGGLGYLTLKEAFARSCNDTFINIAKDLGGNTVVRYAKRFGLGKGLDIGLSNDDGGLPDSQIFAGAGIGNLAIGQGDVMVTPLQMADVIATIVNGGVRKPLRLIEKIISSKGDIIEIKQEHEV